MQNALEIINNPAPVGFTWRQLWILVIVGIATGLALAFVISLPVS
jgi:hypothetical protein